MAFLQLVLDGMLDGAGPPFSTDNESELLVIRLLLDE